MPSALPDGDPAPSDGALPPTARAAVGGHPFGVYVHVPFCSVRCGYCDFNTYTAGELGGSGVPTAAYADSVLAELDVAVRVLGDRRPEVSTVYLGGGTPTMLEPGELVRILDGIRARFGLVPGAEVTTEANPDSVSSATLRELADGGFTRVSLGMQSAVARVLAALDRTHDPDNVAHAVEAARGAGLNVSVDLIYGTPGESMEDWQTSLSAVTDLAPDHVSAYALVVEEGTRLAAQVRRGEVLAPTDDDEAAKYEAADAHLSAAGYHWYELSNWARTPGDRCRHNELYWRGDDWWGAGPGAHSHVGGVRWWNVRHPAAYVSRLTEGRSPAAAREVLTQEQGLQERILLRSRLVDGLRLSEVPPGGRAEVGSLVAEGLIEGETAREQRRVVLTLRGRLLADTVVRRLLGW